MGLRLFKICGLRDSLRIDRQLLSFSFAVVALGFASALSAQTLTQMYSFETPDDLTAFVVNGALSTVSLNTDPAFASEGTNSLKWEFTDTASFEGAITDNVDLGILGDPPGVDFIRFDFINTNRYAQDDPPVGDPSFANISVNVFGDINGDDVNIQFIGSEQAVGGLEAGAHEIDIDVTGGGLQIGTANVKGFNDYIADGLIVSSFQIYLNKSFSFGDPKFEWTIYIDDIRAGKNAAVIDGDYNGNGVIDAADYTVWLDALGGTELLNDSTPGTVDQLDYDFWKTNFGATGGSGAGLAGAPIPEPNSLLLMFAASAFLYVARRRSL